MALAAVSFGNHFYNSDEHVRFAASCVHDNNDVRFEALLYHLSLI